MRFCRVRGVVSKSFLRSSRKRAAAGESMRRKWRRGRRGRWSEQRGASEYQVGERGCLQLLELFLRHLQIPPWRTSEARGVLAPALGCLVLAPGDAAARASCLSLRGREGRVHARLAGVRRGRRSIHLDLQGRHRRPPARTPGTSGGTPSAAYRERTVRVIRRSTSAGARDIGRRNSRGRGPQCSRLSTCTGGHILSSWRRWATSTNFRSTSSCRRLPNGTRESISRPSG